MAIERCPQCAEPAVSCLPADPYPQVIPEVFSCMCRNGHLWERRHSDGRDDA